MWRDKTNVCVFAIRCVVCGNLLLLFVVVVVFFLMWRGQKCFCVFAIRFVVCDNLLMFLLQWFCVRLQFVTIYIYISLFATTCCCCLMLMWRCQKCFCVFAIRFVVCHNLLLWFVIVFFLFKCDVEKRILCVFVIRCVVCGNLLLLFVVVICCCCCCFFLFEADDLSLEEELRLFNGKI